MSNADHHQAEDTRRAFFTTIAVERLHVYERGLSEQAFPEADRDEILKVFDAAENGKSKAAARPFNAENVRDCTADWNGEQRSVFQLSV